MTVTACAALVQAGDPDRFAAAMTAPPTQRGAMFVLYALNLEAAKAPWLTSEVMIAEMRLQWWRDVVDDIVAGKPPRAHEVAGPLAEVMVTHRLPGVLLDQMIAARRWDIYKDPFEDQAHFETYIDQTAGHLMWAAALTCGAEPRLEPAVRSVAYAQGLANFLRAVPALEEKGRVPLLDGREAGLRDLAARGMARLNQVRAEQFGPALPAVRTGWQAQVILRQAVKDPARVGDGRLGTSEMRKRGSLLVKALTGRW